MIPKIIHQSWKTEDVSTFRKGEAVWWQKKIFKHYVLKSNCEYMFWTDEDCERLILDDPQFHYLKEAWEMSSPIMRSDISRYAMVHKHGGVWMDLDMNSIKPIENLFDNDFDFVSYKATRGSGKNQWVTGNAFFGGVQGSDLMDKMLWEISQDQRILSGRIASRKKKGWMPGSYNYGVLASTGPEALNRVRVKFEAKEQLRDRCFHFPLWKAGSWPCPHQGRPKPEYIRHVRASSWSGSFPKLHWTRKKHDQS